MSSPSHERARLQWNKEASPGYLLNIAAKVARGYLDQLLGEAGSSFATWTVLASLAAEGCVIQRQLAERLSIEGPTLTRHLVNLEAAGLVERVPSLEDRRMTRVQLTPRGRELFGRLERIVLDGTADAVRGFTDTEVETFRTMLLRIVGNIREAQANRQHRLREDP